MSRAAEQSGPQKRYKGVRRRPWGKWVSEIRVPGTDDRLWLGSYSSPEAAAVAHDTAVFFLRGPSSAVAAPGRLNFPDCAASLTWACLSPEAVQRAASDRGMSVDAHLVAGGGLWEDGRRGGDGPGGEVCVGDEVFVFGDLSVEEMEIWM